jgi:ABC-type Na+ efflux pump permease subunit
MQLEHALIIGKREYLTRVKTKGFWIATIGLPVFMAAATVGPAVLLARSETNQRIAIVDETGSGLGQQLSAALSAQSIPARDTEAPQTRRGGEGNVRFDIAVEAPGPDVAAQRKALDARVLHKELGACRTS